MPKKVKRSAFHSLKTLGGFNLLKKSEWRQQRLLIIAYHGLSQDDEHLWNPTLYMTPDYFRGRLELLRQYGCNVLPLEEALQRLAINELPPMSVVLTFDDGTYDFFSLVYPVLKEFELPATLYLTTFYSESRQPVFDTMCSYLLWKGRRKTLNLKHLSGEDARIELTSATNRMQAVDKLRAYAASASLSANEKEELSSAVSRQLNINYEDLAAKRVFNLLEPQEVAQLAQDGIDMQMHTHRHRVPRNRELFIREIEDNRKSIEKMTGTRATHFCYPNGTYDSRFLPWLRESGVVSATTCEPGLASSRSDLLLLPRLIDTSLLSNIEFEGWLTGAAMNYYRMGKVLRQVRQQVLY